jgi:hypothetical protein
MKTLATRKSGTTWDMVCNWVNSQGVGTVFNTRDYLYQLNDVPVRPWAHNQHHGPDYRLHQYKGYLGRLGFIKNVSYGKWEVIKPIPHWFNLGHAQHIFCYTGTERYNGLLADQIKLLAK